MGTFSFKKTLFLLCISFYLTKLTIGEEPEQEQSVPLKPEPEESSKTEKEVPQNKEEKSEYYDEDGLTINLDFDPNDLGQGRSWFGDGFTSFTDVLTSQLGLKKSPIKIAAPPATPNAPYYGGYGSQNSYYAQPQPQRGYGYPSPNPHQQFTTYPGNQSTSTFPSNMSPLSGPPQSQSQTPGFLRPPPNHPYNYDHTHHNVNYRGGVDVVNPSDIVDKSFPHPEQKKGANLDPKLPPGQNNNYGDLNVELGKDLGVKGPIGGQSNNNFQLQGQGQNQWGQPPKGGRGQNQGSNQYPQTQGNNYPYSQERQGNNPGQPEGQLLGPNHISEGSRFQQRPEKASVGHNQGKQFGHQKQQQIPYGQGQGNQQLLQTPRVQGQGNQQGQVQQPLQTSQGNQQLLQTPGEQGQGNQQGQVQQPLQTSHVQGQGNQQDQVQQPLQTSHGQGQGNQQPLQTSHMQGQGNQQPLQTPHVQGQGNQQPLQTPHVQGQGNQQPLQISHGQGQGNQQPLQTPQGHNQGTQHSQVQQPFQTPQGQNQANQQPLPTPPGQNQGAQPGQAQRPPKAPFGQNQGNQQQPLETPPGQNQGGKPGQAQQPPKAPFGQNQRYQQPQPLQTPPGQNQGAQHGQTQRPPNAPFGQNQGYQQPQPLQTAQQGNQHGHVQTAQGHNQGIQNSRQVQQPPESAYGQNQGNQYGYQDQHQQPFQVSNVQSQGTEPGNFQPHPQVPSTPNKRSAPSSGFKKSTQFYPDAPNHGVDDTEFRPIIPIQENNYDHFEQEVKASFGLNHEATYNHFQPQPEVFHSPQPSDFQSPELIPFNTPSQSDVYENTVFEPYNEAEVAQQEPNHPQGMVETSLNKVENSEGAEMDTLDPAAYEYSDEYFEGTTASSISNPEKVPESSSPAPLPPSPVYNKNYN